MIVEVSEDGSSRGNHRFNFHNAMMGIATNIKLPKEPEDALCYDFFFNPGMRGVSVRKLASSDLAL